MFLVRATIDESEEKAIPQLAITYGVLRRLGFAEDLVERCLQSIEGIDLEQAVEWVRNLCRNRLSRIFTLFSCVVNNQLSRGRVEVHPRPRRSCCKSHQVSESVG